MTLTIIRICAWPYTNCFRMIITPLKNLTLLILERNEKIVNHKVKVKFTLEQATMAKRGSRGIAPLFL